MPSLKLVSDIELDFNSISKADEVFNSKQVHLERLYATGSLI
jgi:hypothetical protein